MNGLSLEVRQVWGPNSAEVVYEVRPVRAVIVVSGMRGYEQGVCGDSEDDGVVVGGQYWSGGGKVS